MTSVQSTIEGHTTHSAELGIRSLLQQSRRRGERLLAWLRLFLAPAATATFLIGKLATATFYGAALEYLYLLMLAALSGYSLFVLLLLKRRDFHRTLSFASSILDVSAVSLSIVVLLIYVEDPAVATVAVNLAYALYFPAILLSLGRQDAESSALAGALAALQYLAVIASLRSSAAVLLHYLPPSPNPIGSLPAGEVVKAFMLLLSGVVSFSLIRHVNSRQLLLARTEDELRLGQQYLAQFFESTPEAIVLSDNDTRILRINRAFTELFGYTEQEAVGRLIDDLVAPEALKEEAVRLSEVARGGQEFQVETLRRCKDKRLVDVSILGAPVYFEGRQVAVFGIYRDVSLRKRKERLLEALNQAGLAMQGALTHERIIEVVAQELGRLGYAWTVLLLDESRTRLRVKHIGFDSTLVQAGERLLGLDRAHIQLAVSSSEDISTIIEKGETRFVEDSTVLIRSVLPGRLKALAGRLIQVMEVSRTIAAPLVEDEKIIGILAVHSASLTSADTAAIIAFANQLSASWRKISLIGELKRNIDELGHTQAQLLQAQKMEAVGRLAGGIAHDFNNLLTVIRGYSELLLAEPESERSVSEAVREIRTAAEQASQLTEHLLAFSRKQVLQPQVVNLNDVVRRMGKILQRLIGEDISLQTVLERDLRPVRIDPAQIEQVIMNLVVNARDAMPEGGVLHIETANARMEDPLSTPHPEVVPGTYVSLSITDSGHGIPEQIMAHIFEPFFTTKERGRGTGLGLSTVYGIVKQSLGYVYADNLPQGGARFTLFFPPAEEGAATAVAGEELSRSLQGSERILLVEDDDTVRQLTRTILQRSGYSVLVAPNGKVALQIADEDLETVRLLITDVVMPGMNGRDLARAFRERQPELRVLFFSGYAEAISGIPDGLEQEAAFLQKPFTRIALLRKVREILAR